MTKEELLNQHPDPEAKEWFESRPPQVQAAILETPPDCYRSLDNPGHYRLYSYEEPVNSKEITVKLIHGRDSFLPGVLVFGVDRNSLLRCGCGKWQGPTKEQVRLTKKRLDAEKKRFKKEQA